MADGAQPGPEWIRKTETRQQWGFSEKDKDEEGNKKTGELIKTEEGALHRREYPDFCRFNLLFL